MPRKNKQTPHTPFVFKSSCANKRRFAAKHLAESAREYQQLTQQDLELSIYKCELCGGWHLTRQNREDF